MAKLDADGGNNRNQGIFKGMEDNDFQFRLALGLSSCNVVLPDDLQHTGSGHSGDSRCRTGTNGNRGKDHIGPSIKARCWEYLPVQREQKHQEESLPEVRHGISDHGQSHSDIIKKRILLYSRYDTKSQPDRNRKKHRASRKF